MSKLFQSIKLNKGFTLIELLIVIGILGVLAATLLLTLNPAAAQQKARDQQRLKDLGTLQTFIEQYLNDGNTAPAVWFAAAPNNANSALVNAVATSNSNSQPCSPGTSNWLGINVCNYIKTVPVDPLNNRSSSCAASATTTIGACLMRYELRTGGATSTEYEIRAHLESPSNFQKIANDGGNNNAGTAAQSYYEIFSSAAVGGILL